MGTREEAAAIAVADEGALARDIAASPPGTAASAEAELCRRFAPRIRLYGIRHLRDEQAAADLAQQVLVLTLESLRHGRVREPNRIASFVLGTCRTVVRDLRKARQRREQLLDRFATNLVAENEPPATGLDRDRLRECLSALAERERMVLVMTFYAERTTAEIAQELGLSAGNVRVVRHRALTRLAECVRADLSGGP